MDEEYVIHAGLIVIGTPIVAVTLATGGTWGMGTTLAALAVILGVVAFIRAGLRNWAKPRVELPVARVHERVERDLRTA